MAWLNIKTVIRLLQQTSKTLVPDFITGTAAVQRVRVKQLVRIEGYNLPQEFILLQFAGDINHARRP